MSDGLLPQEAGTLLERCLRKQRTAMQENAYTRAIVFIPKPHDRKFKIMVPLCSQEATHSPSIPFGGATSDAASRPTPVDSRPHKAPTVSTRPSPPQPIELQLLGEVLHHLLRLVAAPDTRQHRHAL